MVERKVRLRSRPVWFLPIRVSGSIRLAVRTNRQAVEALNTVAGYAVVAAATINLEAKESLTVFLGQLLLSPDEGALIVLLEADLDIRGKAAPAVAKPVGRASNDPRDNAVTDREFEIISVNATKAELPPAVKIEPKQAPTTRAKNDPRGA